MFLKKKVSPRRNNSRTAPSLHQALYNKHSQCHHVCFTDGKMDRTPEFLQMWLKLHRFSLALGRMIISLISNHKPRRFATSPIFSVSSEPSNNMSVEVWVPWKWTGASIWIYCRCRHHLCGSWHVGRAVDNGGCEQSQLRSVQTLCCSGLSNMLVLHGNLSLSSFLMTLFSDYELFQNFQA